MGELSASLLLGGGMPKHLADLGLTLGELAPDRPALRDAKPATAETH
jgi:hypothetical protein